MNQKRNGFSSGKQLFFLFLLFFLSGAGSFRISAFQCGGGIRVSDRRSDFPGTGHHSDHDDPEHGSERSPGRLALRRLHQRGKKFFRDPNRHRDLLQSRKGQWTFRPCAGNKPEKLLRGRPRFPRKSRAAGQYGAELGTGGSFLLCGRTSGRERKISRGGSCVLPVSENQHTGTVFCLTSGGQFQTASPGGTAMGFLASVHSGCGLHAAGKRSGKTALFCGAGIPERKLVSLHPFDSVSGRIWFEEETPLLRFSAANFTNRDAVLPVTLRLTSEEGKSRSIVRRISIPADTIRAPLVLPLKNPGCGFYQVEAEIGPEKRRFRFTLSILPRIAGSAGALAEYLGTAGTTEPAILGKLGIRWMRSWGRPDFVWYLLEPSSGKFDFRTADALLEETHRNNVRVLAVLGYPPFWAAEPPRPTGKGSVFPISRDAGNPAP